MAEKFKKEKIVYTQKGEEQEDKQSVLGVDVDIEQIQKMLADGENENISAYIAGINHLFQDSDNFALDFKKCKREYVAKIKSITDEQERKDFFDSLWLRDDAEKPFGYHSEEGYSHNREIVNREFAEYCIEDYNAIKFSDDAVNATVIKTLARYDPEGFLLRFDQEEVVRLGIQNTIIDTIYSTAPKCIGEYFDRLPIQQEEQTDLIKRYAAEYPKEFISHFNAFDLKESTREQYLLKMSLLDGALQAEPEIFHNLSSDLRINKPHDREQLREKAEMLVMNRYRKILIDLESRVDREKGIYTIEMTDDEFAFMQDRPYKNTGLPPTSEKHITPEAFFLFWYGNTAKKKVKFTPEEEKQMLQEAGGSVREKIEYLQSERSTVSVVSFGDVENPILNQKIASEVLKQIKFSGSAVEKYVDAAMWGNQEVALETLKESVGNGAVLLKQLRDDGYKYRGLKEVIQDSFNHLSIGEVELGKVLKEYMPKNPKLQKRIIHLFARKKPYWFCKSIADIGPQGISELKKNSSFPP